MKFIPLILIAATLLIIYTIFGFEVTILSAVSVTIWQQYLLVKKE